MSAILGRITFKKSNTAPVLRLRLTDSVNGVDTPVNLTGATVLMKFLGVDSETASSAAATIENAADGVISYDWSGAETDAPGVYLLEVQATLSGGGLRSFPSNGYLEVTILRALG